MPQKPRDEWRRYDRWLGKQPDGKIAAAMGISRIAVVKRRAALGVAAYMSPARARARIAALEKRLAEVGEE